VHKTFYKDNIYKSRKPSSSVLVINFLRHFTGENLFFYVHKPVYISTPLAEYKKYQGKFHIIKYSIFIFQGVVREEKWCLN